MLTDKLIEAALGEAQGAGAQYAEVRAETSVHERIHVRSGSAETLATDHDEGWGIHALVDGGWGFASAALETPEAVRETALRAVEIARASAARQNGAAAESGFPSERGEYNSEVREDPGSVSFAERVDMMVEVTNRMERAHPRVQVTTGTLQVSRTEKRFRNSEGADLRQGITFVGGWIAAIARDETGYAYRRSYGDMKQGGWEHLTALDLPGNAERVGTEAGELVAAPWAPSGPHTVVLSSDMVALMVHESCGHPTELDRVLGWEAAFAGTSFLNPDMLGQFRYGSPLVNMTADSLLPGGLGTFGWDDEGTPAQRTPIVRDGIFSGYLTHRGSAAALGQASNGCGRATNWGRIPLVRMVNLSLEPGSGSFEDVVGQVEDGLYLETPSSWSLDDKRMNFHFSAELCREIKGGKLGELRKGAGYQGRTPTFWGSVRAIAGPEDWRFWGLPHCAKGEPLQLCPVSHGASPILVDGVDMSEARR
jgi:TldD protein